MNEPRCETWLAANADCNTRVQNWLEKMAKFVRQNDPNHLITVGSEGFFGPSTPQLAAQYNPQDWASTMGQDFVENTNIPEIDYATVHAWPDNWELSVVSGTRRDACVVCMRVVQQWLKEWGARLCCAAAVWPMHVSSLSRWPQGVIRDKELHGTVQTAAPK